MNSNKSKGNVQLKQVLEHLLIYGTVTTTEYRDKLSIMHPAARIKNLRDQGWPIGTCFYQQTDASGVTHRAAQYYLQKEKLAPEQLDIAITVLKDERKMRQNQITVLKDKFKQLHIL